MNPSFAAFRQEQYRAVLSRGGRRGRAGFEALFDFLVAPGEVSDSYRKALVSLLDWTESGPPGPFPLGEVVSFFPSGPVYGRCFLDLLERHPRCWKGVEEKIPENPDELEEPAFLAWAGLLLEAGLREGFAGPAGRFLTARRPEESARVLQAELACLWSSGKETGVTGAGMSEALEACREKLNTGEVPPSVRFALAGEEARDPGLLRRQIPFLEDPGLVVFQFLFYGDPDSAGAGDSGGLATLMRDLGGALSEKEAVAGVITLGVYDTASASRPYEPLSFPSPRHALVRLPLYLAGGGSRGFLPFRQPIRRALERFFNGLDLTSLPGRPVFHLRYLDGVSEVLSRMAAERAVPLVTTLTPDPHRRIIAAGVDGGDAVPLEERLLRFYKVLTGDALLERSAGIAGIGKNSVAGSLLSWYPALADPGRRVVRGIDEGIRLMESAPGVDLTGLLCGGGALFAINPAQAGRPVILNVGRLHPAKGQYNLVRAWAEAELWRTHNLFLVGGDFQRPSPAEAEVIEQIKDIMTRHPALKGRLRFQPSTPNGQIRILQEALGRRNLSPHPDIYFCSSLKEEFGISIIEAMGAGMVVLAPLSGGSWEYIRHGINGFRVDTSGAEALGREFKACVCESGLTPERFRAVGANARRTVRERYSLEKVADDFIRVYHKVTGDIPKGEDNNGK